jgi:hypothetical protein
MSNNAASCSSFDSKVSILEVDMTYITLLTLERSRSMNCINRDEKLPLNNIDLVIGRLEYPFNAHALHNVSIVKSPFWDCGLTIT